MTDHSDNLRNTRDRLLEAAGEVFAEQGFRSATVRDICHRAGANIAAVNYHFRDKEGLYREVLHLAGRFALEKYPMVEAAATETPEQRLETFVHNYLDRLLDAGRPAWHGQLISREIVEPTSALDDLAMHFVRPQYDRLRRIVSELLGPEAAVEPQVRWCACSVVGQCLFYKHARAILERIEPNQGFGPADRSALAGHITAFALAGIASIRHSLPEPIDGANSGGRA